MSWVQVHNMNQIFLARCERCLQQGHFGSGIDMYCAVCRGIEAMAMGQTEADGRKSDGSKVMGPMCGATLGLIQRSIRPCGHVFEYAPSWNHK